MSLLDDVRNLSSLTAFGQQAYLQRHRRACKNVQLRRLAIDDRKSLAILKRSHKFGSVAPYAIEEAGRGFQFRL